jgi:glutamyl-tRNA reductase
MRLVMLGLNHRTASVELREKLALPDERADTVARSVRELNSLAEVVVVSTCNRTELYIARPVHAPPDPEEIVGILAEVCGVEPATLTPAVIHRENEQALAQLFRVCAGLDSMVVGEYQIVSQIKRAYERAIDAGTVGQVLHKAFQQALAVAKQVRTETGIGEGRVSVGSVAVDFAKQIFERFDDKVVLGIGAGEMAKITLTHLQHLKPAKLWLANRTAERAATLAAKLGLSGGNGGARPYEMLDELLVEADIVLTSTGSPQPILTAERLRPLIKRRRSRPLFIIDIALPRDAETEVGSLKNVYLYNLDDLQRVIEQTQGKRTEEVAACERILGDAVTRCMAEIQTSDVGRLIHALRNRLHELGRAEHERTLRKLENASPEELPELLEEHTNRLVNKILHLPLSQLHRRHDTAAMGLFAAALRRLFALPDTDDIPPAPAEPVRKPEHERTGST